MKRFCKAFVTLFMCGMLTLNVFGADICKESLTYLYGGTTVSYLKLINATKDSLKTVSPDYFDVNADGNLLITPSDKIDKAFIDEMHNRGIAVVPFISNHWDRTLGNTALKNREALSTQIVQMIERYNLDGINIDIENVNEQYRTDYTEFTRLLREKLPKDKIVSVAVAANPKGWNVGWHGSYDYNALSKYSDYLMIMAYDESYHGGPAGPVSSSSFFEGSIKYALNQGVPADKVVVGIPFFGRYWKSGDTVGGIGISDNDVKYLLANYQSTYRYDDVSQSANATVYIKPEDPKPKVWGGRILTEGTYNIWYDDEKAIKYKLNVADAYNLNGVGSWALGQEDPATWDFYKETLCKNQPTPTPTPTATPTPTPTPTPTVTPAPTETPSTTPTPTVTPAPTATPTPTPTATPTPTPTPTTKPGANKKPRPKTASEKTVKGLGNILDKKLGKKTSETTKLTRGDAAVLLAELAYVKPSDKDGYTDIKSFKGKGQVNALKEREILEFGNGKFLPSQNITKAELCMILDNMLVLPDTIDFHTLPYTDVSKKCDAYYSICKLYYFDLVDGANKTEFKPDSIVTLEDMALIWDIIDYYKFPVNPDRQLKIKGLEPLETR